jgi:hypothetical protein
MKDIDPNRLGLIRIAYPPELESTSEIEELLLEEISDNLVGCEFPCLYFDEEGKDISTESEPAEGPLYIVLQETAIEVISDSDPDAAMIWHSCGFPEPGYSIFGFRDTIVEVLKQPMSRDEFIKEFAQDEYLRSLN